VRGPSGPASLAIFDATAEAGAACSAMGGRGRRTGRASTGVSHRAPGDAAVEYLEEQANQDHPAIRCLASTFPCFCWEAKLGDLDSDGTDGEEVAGQRPAALARNIHVRRPYASPPGLAAVLAQCSPRRRGLSSPGRLTVHMPLGSMSLPPGAAQRPQQQQQQQQQQQRRPPSQPAPLRDEATLPAGTATSPCALSSSAAATRQPMPPPSTAVPAMPRGDPGLKSVRCSPSCISRQPPSGVANTGFTLSFSDSLQASAASTEGSQPLRVPQTPLVQLATSRKNSPRGPSPGVRQKQHAGSSPWEDVLLRLVRHRSPKPSATSSSRMLLRANEAATAQALQAVNEFEHWPLTVPRLSMSASSVHIRPASALHRGVSPPRRSAKPSFYGTKSFFLREASPSFNSRSMSLQEVGVAPCSLKLSSSSFKHGSATRGLRQAALSSSPIRLRDRSLSTTSEAYSYSTVPGAACRIPSPATPRARMARTSGAACLSASRYKATSLTQVSLQTSSLRMAAPSAIPPGSSIQVRTRRASAAAAMTASSAKPSSTGLWLPPSGLTSAESLAGALGELQPEVACSSPTPAFAPVTSNHGCEAAGAAASCSGTNSVPQPPHRVRLPTPLGPRTVLLQRATTPPQKQEQSANNGSKCTVMRKENLDAPKTPRSIRTQPSTPALAANWGGVSCGDLQSASVGPCIDKELRRPGAKHVPATVGDGSSATGAAAVLTVDCLLGTKTGNRTLPL